MALFLDVDGTLIDIAPRPEAVFVPADLPDDLAAAARQVGGALALVSGRTIAELDRLFAPVRLPASGVHGAETRLDADEAPTRAPPLPDAVRARVSAVADRFAGVEIEDKGASLAVHFRRAPAVHGALREALKDAAGGLSIAEGDMVFELKRPGVDKGAALRHFMKVAPFAGRQPVFVSDHFIDTAGFAAAVSLGGAAFSVGARLPGTTGSFAGPQAVRAWLKAIAG